MNLDDNVFQCFDKKCGQKGDVIDLWARVKGLSLLEAALDLEGGVREAEPEWRRDAVERLQASKSPPLPHGQGVTARVTGVT